MVGADIGMHPPGARVDADNRLWQNSTPSWAISRYGSRTSSADWRPSITSSFEKAEKERVVAVE